MARTNDARISNRAWACGLLAPALVIPLAGVLEATPAPAAASTATPMAYVANAGSNTVTPINTVTGKAGIPIPVALLPTAVVASPNGKTVYAVSFGNDESGAGAGITPISTATNTAGSEIPVPAPVDMTVASNGSAAYVLSGYQACCQDPNGDIALTPINTAGNSAGTPIQVDANTTSAELTPNGKSLVILSSDSTDTSTTLASSVSVINTATGTVAKAFSIAGSALAITPNGGTAYVIVPESMQNSQVIPIFLSSNTLGPFINIRLSPVSITMTKAGETAYVVATPDPGLNPGPGNGADIVPINTTSNLERTPIALNNLPSSSFLPLAVAPNGKSAYLVVESFNGSRGEVVPVNLTNGHISKPIIVNSPTAIAISPNGKTAYVVNGQGGRIGRVIPINTATNTRGKPIMVGNDPEAITIAG
jgi:DNA-binding beta-propeller fold protein YncE